MSFNFDFDSVSPDDFGLKGPVAIEYIKSLEPKILIDDSLAFKALFYLAKRTHLIDFNQFYLKDLAPVFAKIFCEFYELKVELNFENFEMDIYDYTVSIPSSNHRITVLGVITLLVNKAFMSSVKFTKSFSNQGGLEAYFLFLKDDEFLKKAVNTSIKDFSGNKINLIKSLVVNIYILSKSCDENLQKWIDLDSVNILLKVARLCQNTQLEAYLAIANVATDKQMESLEDINLITRMLQSRIHLCAEDFRNNKKNLLHRQIVENDEIIDVTVHCIEEVDGVFTSILVFLSGMYKLCINDKQRHDIFFSQNTRDDLKSILFNGNNIETQYTLRLYCQLVFNSIISQDISNDLELMKYFSDKNQTDLCRRILWLIDQSKLSQKEFKTSRGQHVMISYNRGSRELCVKIKNQLESYGIPVWIDVDSIYGSSLDSMAKAVENSFCVLICITEMYRQSVNCQSEAQYAFRLNKPIIPLIMQKDYENVKGWLGIILSDKIFINFTKYNYEECIRRLKHEIDSLSGKNKNNWQNKEQNETKNWTENQVKDWLESNKISNLIYELFFPCDGSVLHQLYEMRRDAPEFFYQSLNKKQNDLRSIIHFTQCLNKLFD